MGFPIFLLFEQINISRYDYVYCKCIQFLFTLVPSRCIMCLVCINNICCSLSVSLNANSVRPLTSVLVCKDHSQHEAVHHCSLKLLILLFLSFAFLTDLIMGAFVYYMATFIVDNQLVRILIIIENSSCFIVEFVVTSHR